MNLKRLLLSMLFAASYIGFVIGLVVLGLSFPLISGIFIGILIFCLVTFVSYLILDSLFGGN